MSPAPPARSGSDLPSPRLRRVVDRVPFLDKELFVLRDLVGQGGVVIDVGAAGGAHTFVAADLVGPDGRVLAVEARSGSARLLRGWRRVLRADHVTVVNAALGAAPGDLELRVPLVPTRSHADTGPGGGDDGTWLARLPARTATIGMTTLDHLVATHGLARVDLVKIDVEGGEPDVLAGATATLADHRPALLVEVYEPFLRRTGRSADDVFDLLASAGYRPHRFGDDGLEPVDGHAADEHNYVFLGG